MLADGLSLTVTMQPCGSLAGFRTGVISMGPNTVAAPLELPQPMPVLLVVLYADLESARSNK